MYKKKLNFKIKNDQAILDIVVQCCWCPLSFMELVYGSQRSGRTFGPLPI